METVRCCLDGIPFVMKEPFDFSFLSEYGKVFRVFDDQDSGNICFGVERSGVRRFIKFAGAKTARSCISPEEAVENLRKTVSIYRDLHHESLIELLECKDTGGGYAMVFDWVDGECMGRMYPEAHARFMAMPIAARLSVFSVVQRFMAHVHACGYTAIDYYDGSVLCNPETLQTYICDIDLFRKKPCINDMGRMWGSSRFMSPEEFELGASLDEITNVYTLGAFAFALFADCSRDRESWPLGNALYAIAAQAVQPNRARRQPSIAAFMEEWQTALHENPLDVNLSSGI